MFMHDLLCDVKCRCGLLCFGHPKQPKNFHKCQKCLIKSKWLVMEKMSFIEQLKETGNGVSILITYCIFYFPNIVMRLFKCTSR